MENVLFAVNFMACLNVATLISKNRPLDFKQNYVILQKRNAGQINLYYIAPYFQNFGNDGLMIASQTEHVVIFLNKIKWLCLTEI